jgi:integrase
VHGGRARCPSASIGATSALAHPIGGRALDLVGLALSRDPEGEGDRARVGLYTGTRSGAICNAALTPAIGRGFIDLENGVFYRRALGTAETKKRQPTASIAPRLLAHMRRWARLGLSRSSVIEFDGMPVKSVRKAFARAAQSAGWESVTPHTLRHTAASWAMQKGAPVDLVADALGMTPETLRRVYGHLHPEHHAVVWDAIAGGRAASGRNQRNETR